MKNNNGLFKAKWLAIIFSFDAIALTIGLFVFDKYFKTEYQKQQEDYLLNSKYERKY